MSFRVVSARGSPAHPRAARRARGLLVRPIGSLPDPSPQALVPCCRQLPDELCPSTRAILARLSAIPDAPFGGGPIRSRPAHRPRTTPQQLRATPRQATTPGPPSLRALTRVPSCATGAHRAVQSTPAAPTGSAFPLETGSVFLLGTSGGIRSATFGLGAIQALAELKLLPTIDYQSSVSGGGYISSWLAAWIKREGVPRTHPATAATPGTGDPLMNVARQLKPNRRDQATAKAQGCGAGKGL